MRVSVIPTVLCLLVFVRVAGAAPRGDACKIPAALQHDIAVRYPRAKLVTLSALDADDRGFFQKDHGDACPGLTRVDFYGDGNPTLALVLIEKGDTKEKAELVVAHRVGGQWKTALLDTANGVPVPVVWSRPPGHYTDIYGKEEIRATEPVIVFTGYESWSILYAWKDRRVRKIWLMD